ncbi:hypothetical protein BRADI_2g47403v3 [Brachypodium distachyon]|uniref:Uncharacterized protein n=1 Tax=Brachypodium distachyon TaxID=15368 RepID=A0A2K2DEE4_BRADI|nr:hypothetical protein BRADI_2g47403v3 [Brachypodium distachyon]
MVQRQPNASLAELVVAEAPFRIPERAAQWSRPPLPSSSPPPFGRPRLNRQGRALAARRRRRLPWGCTPAAPHPWAMDPRSAGLASSGQVLRLAVRRTRVRRLWSSGANRGIAGAVLLCCPRPGFCASA